MLLILSSTASPDSVLIMSTHSFVAGFPGPLNWATSSVNSACKTTLLLTIIVILQRPVHNTITHVHTTHGRVVMCTVYVGVGAYM